MTTEHSDTRWKRNASRRFKITFSYLLPDDQKVIWKATTKICNAKDPAKAYPHAICSIDVCHVICRIEEGWILAFDIIPKDNQVKFVSFYK